MVWIVSKAQSKNRSIDDVLTAPKILLKDLHHQKSPTNKKICCWSITIEYCASALWICCNIYLFRFHWTRIFDTIWRYFEKKEKYTTDYRKAMKNVRCFRVLESFSIEFVLCNFIELAFCDCQTILLIIIKENPHFGALCVVYNVWVCLINEMLQINSLKWTWQELVLWQHFQHFGTKVLGNVRIGNLKFWTEIARIDIISNVSPVDNKSFMLMNVGNWQDTSRRIYICGMCYI